jgi:hypothetical protein
LIINESFSCFQVTLIAALISVAFTSRLYCELADNLQAVYPDLDTFTVRSVFQAFATICLLLTILILLAHIFGIRYFGKRFSYLNQIVSNRRRNAKQTFDETLFICLVFNSQCCHGIDDDIYWYLCCIMGR